MKNIYQEIIKSIGISILIIIAIILLIMVICYDKISVGKIVPKVEEYQLSDEIKNELEYEKTEENTTIITTYTIDASDLKKYEKTKEYNKGKKNPFSTDTSSEQSNNSNSANNNTTTNTNFYEDEGIK